MSDGEVNKTINNRFRDSAIKDLSQNSSASVMGGGRGVRKTLGMG